MADVLWQVACDGKVLYEGDDVPTAQQCFTRLLDSGHEPTLYRAIVEWEVIAHG